MLGWLNESERRNLDAWINEQPIGENGALQLMKWPGWLDAFARAKREANAPH